MDWHKLFIYDENSPSCLVNKVTRSSRNLAGNATGSLYNYWVVSTSSGAFMAHRVIWEMFNGPIPSGMQIDHINTNKLDNRLANLRLATRSNNQMNQVLRSDNSSGVKGIYWHKSTQSWCAELWVNRKRVWRAYRKDMQALAELLDAKRKEFHGKFARTSTKLKGDYETDSV